MNTHSMNIKNVKAIILAGSRDFGRCPLASRLPTALWPVVGEPVLARLLAHLANQGIKEAVICSNGDGALLQQSIHAENHIKLRFLDEQLPAGTAGCIRDAVDADTKDLLLILHATVISPPDVSELIRAHQKGKADLTIMFEPNSHKTVGENQVAEIYICEPTVLRFIPHETYCDIKESLIPEMLRAGKNVHAATLSKPTRSFRDHRGYLTAISCYLENDHNINRDFPGIRRKGQENIWLADTASVDPSARIIGPVIITNNAVIAEKTIIFGPTIIGTGVTVGKNTLVENSVFWDGSHIGQTCHVCKCVFDYEAAVPKNTVLDSQAVPYRQNGKFSRVLSSTVAIVNSGTSKLNSVAQSLLHRTRVKLPPWARTHKLKTDILRAFVVGILTSVFLWAYWPTVTELWGIWLRSDEYSSGLLVPFLALYILWIRRHSITRADIQPSLWGLLAFALAQAVRIFGTLFMYSSAERLSLLLSVVSLVILIFGWRILRKVATVLAFLSLMLPLPRSVHTSVTLPLQNLATTSSVFCLQMIGYTVVREGNIIHLNDITVAVAEACNGLRMVTAFFVIIGLLVLLVRRALWEKLVVLILGLPVALLCNTVRLTGTAILSTILKGEIWEKVFHDFGGYAMMPLAVAFIVAELWFVDKLTVPPEEKKEIIILRQKK
jgi:exosortase